MSLINTNKLSNGIKVITKINPKTPRTSIFIGFDSGTKYQNKAGLAGLMSRLLMQGTKTRSDEQIANEIDLNALEIEIDIKQDYAKARALFLNEDLDKALELLSDLISNPTFEKFEKEVNKIKGEIQVELDSPKTKAMDNLIKNVYPKHPYGDTYTRVLEEIDSITKDDVMDFYNNLFVNQTKNIVVVGDFNEKEILEKLEFYFGKFDKNASTGIFPKIEPIKESKTVTITKNDAAQAQIIQGWIVPEMASEDYPPLTVMNTILGAGGLSSRLFLELRDKKGLAYHVRSTYEPLKESGNYTVYIGTAPNNIKTCLEGFKEEIQKLQTIPVSEEELLDAKNNYLGKRTFHHETNYNQAYYLGLYDILGLGAEFDEKIPELIKNVKADDVQRVANKYLSANSITSILAPEEFLKQID